MQITVSTKHLDNADNLKQHAIEKTEKLDRFLNRIERVDVILGTDGEKTTAEVIVIPARGESLVGKSTESDGRIAIDRAVSKMERLLAKRKGRVKEHRKGLPEAEPAPPVTDDDEAYEPA